jgi:phosphoribosylglycinamide formyltransferase-1
MGQFGFFRNYLRKMSQTIFGVSSKAPKPQNGSFSIKKRNLALFASGAGSNAQKIIEHFKGHPSIRVSLIVCNKPGAGVIQIAADFDVPVLMIEKKDFDQGNLYVKELSKYEIDYIILAGFLWKMPEAFLNAFPRHMINIHPSLLPKYGGKGMYGSRVHEAVIAAGEKESGITIHYVNGQYDEGEHLFQAACTVDASDTTDTLATKVHALEHLHFARVIEDVIEGKL